MKHQYYRVETRTRTIYKVAACSETEAYTKVDGSHADAVAKKETVNSDG